MPLTLDRDLLTALGLGELSQEDGHLVLTTMYETLQLRVGLVLNRRMTAAQLDRFEAAAARDREESLRVLSEIAPDYAHVVATELEALKNEVALDAPTIRQACTRAYADQDPWRHHRPDLGPTAILGRDDWTLVVSPQASVCIALNPGGTELYARRQACPPVVLAVPDGHTIDRTMLWCDDRGEVRARFATHSDLRWRLAAVPTSPVVGYAKVLHHRRPPLTLVDHRAQGDDLMEITEGRWHVEDAMEIEVTDRFNDLSFRLERLHPASHWNAVAPHFTPDRSQFVVAYNTDEPPEECGLKACSVGHLDFGADFAAEFAAGDPMVIRWEFTVHATATLARRAAGDVTPPIEAVGYDASSARAAVIDPFEAHLFNVRNWRRLGDIARPDQRARVAAVPIPGGAVPLVAWAGRSVVVAARDGQIWRLDLLRGPIDPQPVKAGTGAGGAGSGGAVTAAPVALVSWADRAAAVYADRTIVGIDGDGDTGVTRLPGDDPLEGAAAVIDGRLLLFTAAGLELFAGTRLVAALRTTEPIVGLAPCARDPEWAIAWHADQSVSSVRLGARSLQVGREPLPHLPDAVASVSAIGGEMSDLDRWHLLVPIDAGNRHSSRILSPLGTVTLDATRATSMPSAGMAVFATSDGLEFLPALRPRAPHPSPVPLPAPVEAIATGRCARSVAAVGGGELWLVRLFR